MKRWDIFLRWVVDDLYDTIGFDYGIMYYMRAPSVAVLYTVTEDGIACHILTNEDAITDDKGIVRVGDS